MLFSELSGEQLNWKPNYQTWSIAQNLEHLIVVNETYYPVLSALKKGAYKKPFLANFSFIVSFFGKIASEQLKKLSKKVVQFDLNINLLNTFKSLTEASKITGQSRRAITEQVSLRVLKGKKYIWRYYDPNYDINNINISNKRKTEEIDGKDSQIPME